MSGNQPHIVISFGPFEADLQTQELRRQGVRLRLPGQSFQILKMLLQRPGELVIREELQQALWPSDTHVDFERGVNAAVNRLRDVMGDSADSPQLIETLPRRGYRFIGTLNPPLPIPQTAPEILPNASGPSAASTTAIPAAVQTKVTTSTRFRWMKITAWSLVGLACVSALAFSFYRIRSHADLSFAAPVPFTDYPGFEFCPAFSPDGSQIAFAWSGDPATGAKGDDLYVKVIHSESLLRLTQHSSASICAAWSPDGTQLAFYRFSGDDTGIYLVPALGGPERKLRSAQGGFGISWSADGKWIAYPDSVRATDVIHRMDPTRIYLLSVDTLESRQIPHAEECLAEQTPVFSHSGDRLAYVCLLKINDNEIGIYSVSLSGGSPKIVTRFTTGWGFPRGIAWTADDKRLIVSRPHVGNDVQLEEVTLGEETLRKLPFGQDACCPAISTKGQKLAYSVWSGGHADVWRKDLLHPEVAGVRLISSTFEQAAPQYSPDGKHIAFASNRGGDWEIWMSLADGTSLVRMSDNKSTKAGAPRWSPDSRKLAFDSRQSGHPEIYIVDIAERQPRKLIANLSDMSTPSWSHDGKWLYFEASGQRIFRSPASGGDAVALSAESGSHAFESYDGETLFFVSPAYSPDLHMLSLKQSAKEIAVRGMPALADRSHYTVVPGGIYFVPASASKSIQYFDFATRQVRKIFNLDKETGNGLSVSPDGRWILYTQVGEENSDIMLVDHFK
jgi:Tol biopolymer transport system component/DNA-binding winged helix-turn-helix (wHTH) protein